MILTGRRHLANRRDLLILAASALLTGSASGVVRTSAAQLDRAAPLPSHRRPMFIGRAGLTVQNLEGMVLFYQQVIGLELQSRTEKGAVLGVGGVGLIELVRNPAANRAPAGSAGLYHLALEMPTRADLALWIVHAATNHFQVSGLADHQVTESVYLNDPEGNGLEVYASRPEKRWKWQGGQVAMGVLDLDLEPLLKLVNRDKDDFTVAPRAMRIGHIHLMVGDLKTSEAFYSGLLGFDVTRRAPGVVFMSSGKYHHHVAMNIWESPGAGRRSKDELGLSWFSVTVADQSLVRNQESRLHKAGVSYKATGEGIEVDDPWGNTIRIGRQ